jgi:hypothetical protein
VPEDAADFLIERAKDDPKVRETVLRAQSLHTLLEDPGWKNLYEIVQGTKKRFMQGLASRLMEGEAVTQSEIDYRRGFFDGAEWAASHPKEAIKSLERAAERAYSLAQINWPSTEEGTSPYA